MSLVSYRASNGKSDVIKELELSTIKQGTKPHFFSSGSAIARAQDFTGLKVVEKTNDIALKNSIWAEEN